MRVMPYCAWNDETANYTNHRTPMRWPAMSNRIMRSYASNRCGKIRHRRIPGDAPNLPYAPASNRRTPAAISLPKIKSVSSPNARASKSTWPRPRLQRWQNLVSTPGSWEMLGTLINALSRLSAARVRYQRASAMRCSPGLIVWSCLATQLMFAELQFTSCWPAR